MVLGTISPYWGKEVSLWVTNWLWSNTTSSPYHPHHGYTGWPYSWDYPSATLHLMMTIQNSWPNICNGVTCTCHSSYLNFKLYQRTMLLRNYESPVFVNTNLHIQIPQSTEMSSVDRGSECGLRRWICYAFSEIT